MIKPVSTLSIIVAGVMCIAPTFGAQMTPQIQQLLDQKQEKIKKLEECEGKKQGWMIAGISTIGVTAVGVGLNIAQASKRNRLDDEIDTARHDLEKKQEDLSSIQNQIAEKERERASGGSGGGKGLGGSGDGKGLGGSGGGKGLGGSGIDWSGTFNCIYQDEKSSSYGNLERSGKYLVCGPQGNNGCKHGTIVKHGDAMYTCLDTGKWDSNAVPASVPDCGTDYKAISKRYKERIFVLRPYYGYVFIKNVPSDPWHPIVTDMCIISETTFKNAGKACEQSGGGWQVTNNRLCYCYSSKNLQNKTDSECECKDKGQQYDSFEEKCK